MIMICNGPFFTVRLELHQKMKARQEKELNQLEQTKDTLCEQARSLAEKYEAANENQATLIRRSVCKISWIILPNAAW